MSAEGNSKSRGGPIPDSASSRFREKVVDVLLAAAVPVLAYALVDVHQAAYLYYFHIPAVFSSPTVYHVLLAVVASISALYWAGSLWSMHLNHVNSNSGFFKAASRMAVLPYGVMAFMQLAKVPMDSRAWVEMFVWSALWLAYLFLPPLFGMRQRGGYNSSLVLWLDRVPSPGLVARRFLGVPLYTFVVTSIAILLLVGASGYGTARTQSSFWVVSGKNWVALYIQGDRALVVPYDPETRVASYSFMVLSLESDVPEPVILRFEKIGPLTPAK